MNSPGAAAGDWAELPAATISDAMGRMGAMHAGITRLSGERVAGRAFTVQTGAGDNSTIHRAVNAAPPGAVLVIDAEAHLGRAVWGFVLTVAALKRRLAGAVIDGAVRDIDAIRDLGWPLYARGVCPLGPHKGFEGRVGDAVQCGGVIVAPGDVVVGDADGVAIVPAERATQVFARASARMAEEADWVRRIENGESSLDILGIK
ncbi:MAG: hypothetical protein GEU68_11290 [Actinobacteria bacterium]|nr:hypothetical protein [Actinomycetota bacterium]